MLIAGGGGQTPPPQAVELFDPAAGRFSTGPSLSVPHVGTAGARLPDGRILIAGGCGITLPHCGGPSITICEIYDPATNTLSQTGSLRQGSGAHALVTLPTGRVLLAGGTSANLLTVLGRAELYDPTDGTWTTTSPLSEARVDAAAALLPDGRALVGGGRAATPIGSVELFYPGVAQQCRVCQLDGACTTLGRGTRCAGGHCDGAGACLAP